MVERPEEYRWSSYGVNVWRDKSWLNPNDEYIRLGNNVEERQTAYRELFRYQLSDVDLQLIRKSAHYCRPVSDDRFRKHIEEKYGIKVGQMKRGRPVKADDELVKN